MARAGQGRKRRDRIQTDPERTNSLFSASAEADQCDRGIRKKRVRRLTPSARQSLPVRAAFLQPKYRALARLDISDISYMSMPMSVSQREPG
jgi:hypothetical protein